MYCDDIRYHLLGGCELKEYTRRLDDPFYPRFWPDKLKEINQDPYKNFSESSHQRAYRGKRRAKPRGIFVCDMGDLFGLGIPEEWTRQVLGAIWDDPIDRFFLLTKQPQNLAKFSPFPDNCWVGVSAWDISSYFVATQALKKIKAKVKYVSIEPLLAWQPVLYSKGPIKQCMKMVDWAIIGSVTKHPELPQPKLSWVREIVQACDHAGVKVWLKNSLHKTLWDDALPGYPGWAADPNDKEKLRQDMPEGE